MSELQREIVAWSNPMFPNSTNTGLLTHFREEVAELCEELESTDPDDQNLREECADVMHFLFQIAGRYGFDLLEETRRKFEINQTRTWAASEDGIVRHAKPPATS